MGFILYICLIFHLYKMVGSIDFLLNFGKREMKNFMLLLGQIKSGEGED